MIIVTGANGFIGSFTVRRLNELGRDDVVVVDNFPAIRGQADAAAPFEGLRYTGDMNVARYLDMDDLPAWLDAAGADVEAIVHLGACSDTTVTDRKFVMRVNYQYTRTLWQWCAAGGKPFVYASSAATYGDGERGYSDEADPQQYQPLNLYGESKQQFDLWALEQNEADSPPRWAGIKYFNVYGPYEAHKQRMASVAFHTFNQVRETGKMRLFESHKEGVGHGQQQRDFIYVADAVDATLHFIIEPVSADAPNGLYNVGTGAARTFHDLATAVFTALELEPDIEYLPMPDDLRGKYQYFTQATVDKLRRAGYTKPFYSVEDGVAEYVSFLVQQEAAKA